MTDESYTQTAVERYLQALASLPEEAPYAALPQQAKSIEHEASTQGGGAALALLRAEVMRAASSTQFFRPPCVLDDDTLERVDASRQRILSRSIKSAGEHYVRYPDRYMKDLAILRGMMFPAGARLVQPRAGIPRRIFAAGGPLQAVRFAALLALLRSHRPVFQVHVHPDELEEFTEDGWRRTLGRIARVLALNPGTRALFGNSWLYAPDLPKVSQQLAYIRDIAAQCGCRFFRSGPDASGDALEKSPTRRRLAAEGLYSPTVFAAVWPRAELIARASLW